MVVVGLIISLVPVVGKPVLSGSSQAVLVGLADGLAATGVLVVGCDVADAGVQTGGVVLGAHSIELGPQDDGIGDGQQVRPLVLERAVEGLDPRSAGPGWLGMGGSAGR